MLDLALAGLDLSDLLTAAGAAAGGLLAGGAAGRRVGVEDAVLEARAQALREEGIDHPGVPRPPLWRVLLPALLELAGELVRWIRSRGGRKDGRAALVFPLVLAATGLVLWRWGWGAALAVLVGLVLLEVVRLVVGAGRRERWTFELEELDEDGPDWKRRGAVDWQLAVVAAVVLIMASAVPILAVRQSTGRAKPPTIRELEERTTALELELERHAAHLRAHDVALEITYPARGRQVFPAQSANR